MSKQHKITVAIISIAIAVGIVAIVVYRRRKASEPAPVQTPAGAVELSNEGKPTALLGSKVRGIRNNNPGNLRISATKWQGKIPVAQNTDKAFEQFSTYAYGVRAAIKQIQTYGNRGINTPAKIVATWAPAADNNDEAAYVRAITKNTKTAPDTALDLTNKQRIYEIVNAIGWMENGVDAIPKSAFDAGWVLI